MLAGTALSEDPLDLSANMLVGWRSESNSSF
jgi:hypothetical protein